MDLDEVCLGTLVGGDAGDHDDVLARFNHPFGDEGVTGGNDQIVCGLAEM